MMSCFMNIVDPESKLTSLKPTAVSEHFLSIDHTTTDMQLFLNSLKLIVTVYEKQEKHILQNDLTERGL